MDARPSSVLRPELLREIPCSAGLRVPPDRRLAVARGGAHAADCAAEAGADNRSAPRRFAHLLNYEIRSRMTLQADRIGRRRPTWGPPAGATLAATLTFAATQADAAITAQVKAGTLQIRGDGAADKLQLEPTPTTPVVDVGEDNTADFTFDRSTFTAVSVQAGDGDDEVRVVNAVTPFDMTIDGGAGDDTLIGGNGNETLLGGSGNDFVDGNIGADTARLGGGDDTFEWSPGDGSDSVDGQSGNDALAFRGSNIGEEIHVTPTTLTRNVGATTTAFAGLEDVDVTPLGGVDNVTVAGTDGDDQLDLGDNAIAFGGLRISRTDPEPTDRLIAGGGAGDDTAVFTGTPGDDQISFGRSSDAMFVGQGNNTVVNSRTEHTLIKGLGGNDLIAGQNGVGLLTQTTIDGGAGDDDLRGGDGADTLIGGSGNDHIDGNIGADSAQMGSGDDTFEWDPGHRSDNGDGQSGTDSLDFHGSNIGEAIGVSGHQLTRNVAAITMNYTVEGVNVRTLGGADTVTTGDLGGLKTVNVDLGAFDGSDDAAADDVVVGGTDGDDRFDLGDTAIVSGGTTVSVTNPQNLDRLIADGGLGDDTSVETGTAGDDQISFGRTSDAMFVTQGNSALVNSRTEHTLIKGLGGNDLIAGQNGVGLITQTTIDGGSGDDDLRGGDGADTLVGGPGNDHVDGNIGADSAQMGSGDDTFEWDPSDGSDTVDGQGGTDALDFHGSNIGEAIGVSGHQLTRNVAAITMNYTVEGVIVRTLGGADTVTTGDLGGLKTVNVDLGAFDGSDDAAADDVVVGGTYGDDRFDLGDTAIVSGGTTVSVTNPQNLDRLIADGGLGDDTSVETGTAGDDQISFGRTSDAMFVTQGNSALVNSRTEHTLIKGLGGNDLIAGQNGVGLITQTTIDGGSGDDDLRGGDGADILIGGSGNDHVDGNIGADSAQMGSGDDTFEWDPGDGSDTVDGQGGTDSLAFNGSNIGEQLVASADGSPVRFTRNVAAIAMDLDNVEGLALRSLGGVDQVTVGDLGGTDMKTAAVDLGAFDGTPDATPDTVTVTGTAKRDNVAVTKAGGQVLVNGLPTQTTIAGSDPGVDLLRVNTLDGDDNVTVAPDVADLMATAVDLGADG